MFSQPKPFVRIIEQPASKSLRFRYECEGRSSGSLRGASSTPENKTFPAIQVVGYRGKANVVVSCVTENAPFRPHPHNLVGRVGCKRGVCIMKISPDTMCATFANIGIQCAKKKEIESSLRTREEIRVDPFLTGFSHKNRPTSIDLYAVRLCFQVILENNEQQNKFKLPLDPVVSEPIYDKKIKSDLAIVKLSHCVSYVDGGCNDIILLCEKVAKDDIQVRFFEEKHGCIVWEAYGDVQPSQVHKQTAIWFKPPKYHTLDITQPVKVFIQLQRPSDGATSEALAFEMLPIDLDSRKRKIQKLYDPNQLFHSFEKNSTTFIPNIPINSSVKIQPTEQNAFGQQHNYFYSIPPNYQQPPRTSIPLFLLENNNSNTTDNSRLQVDSLVNVKNHELELQQIDVNSGDLSTSEDMTALSETFSQSVSLTDINKAIHEMYA